MHRSRELNTDEIHRYVAARLPKLRPSGGELRGPCPVHGGRRDSFALNPETGACKCHSECNRGWNIWTLEAELHGGGPKEAAARVREIVGRTDPPPNGKRRIVAEYSYTDAAGALLYQVVRFQPKTFRQRRPDPARAGAWIWNLRGVETVLYRLPRIATAETVYVVEGERDVHTLEQFGLTATTAPGGAGKWRDCYAPWLANKDVIILPDNDQRGRDHAAQVKASVLAVARSVRVIELPNLATHGDVSDWFAAGGDAEQLAAIVAAAPVAAAPAPTETAPLADLFSLRDDGLYALDPQGKARDIWIAPRFEVCAGTRDFRDQNRGKLVRYRNGAGREVTAVIPHTALIADGNDALERMIYDGFKPARARKLRELLKDYIWQCEPARQVRCVMQTGWHDGSYVMPEATIGRGADEIYFQSPDIGIDHKMRQAGTLEEWQRQIGRYCEGNSRLVFSVSAAFAAALLAPCQHECCGFHLRGLSSTGKTTALRVAGSVWGGGGEHGFIDTWRATANGLEARAALHNHALLCLDEISQISEREVGDVVYLLGNGVAKARMTKAITARHTFTFRLLYLSTGERSLRELMNAGGRTVKAGQELRLAEIPVDAGAGMGLFEHIHDAASPAALARHLAHASARVYGSPAVAWLELLAGDLDRLAEEARRLQREFAAALTDEKTGGEVARVAHTFGLIAAAGEIARPITKWSPGEARKAATRCYAAWLEARGAAGPLDIEYGIDAVRAFCSRYSDSRFQLIGDARDAPRDRAGFKELQTGDGVTDPEQWIYYIHEDVFREEVCGVYDYRAVYRAMIARGYGRAQAGRNLAVKKRIPRAGSLRFFVVLPALFADEDDADLFAGEKYV